MPTTFGALAVAVLAILPGAAYTFAYESRVGAFRLTLPDRIIRFLVASAALHAIAAGLTYHLYRTQVHSGRLVQGKVSSYLIEFAALGYVLLPLAAGWIIGTARDRNWPIIRRMANGNYHPRAWDYLFSQQLDGCLRLRLKSGDWIAGMYRSLKAGEMSYAAGYGEDADLYLAETIRVNRETGEFDLDENDEPVVEFGGILVRWAEVEYAQFFQIGR